MFGCGKLFQPKGLRVYLRFAYFIETENFLLEVL